jgi:hypothetical protein
MISAIWPTESSRSGSTACERSDLRRGRGGHPAGVRRDDQPVTSWADDPAMTRRSDPARIETARRAATIARLISDGHSAAVATGLVGEWEVVQAAS